MDVDAIGKADLMKRRRLEATVLPVHFEDPTTRGASLRCLSLTRTLVVTVLLASCSKSPPRAPTTVAGTNTNITGTVVERVEGAPYTFLRLETEKGQVWIGVPMAEVPKTTKVTVKSGALLKNFESKQAGRKFEVVVFGILE